MKFFNAVFNFNVADTAQSVIINKVIHLHWADLKNKQHELELFWSIKIGHLRRKPANGIMNNNRYKSELK